MKEIVFVTTNKDKIAYANDVIKHTKVISYEYDLVEPRSDDLRVIAEAKVRQAYLETNKPCIAMDIGFFIKALNGFPRAYVNHALDTIGIEGILKLMEGEEDRYCEFRECLAYFDGSKVEFFESIGPGKIANSIRGRDKEDKLSDLWYIVEPNGFGKTIAEFDSEDSKRHRKHRMKSSLSLFGEWFDETE